MVTLCMPAIALRSPFDSINNTPTPVITNNPPIGTDDLHVFHCHYVSCDSALKVIQQPNSPWLSKNGQISISQNQHTLWVDDDSSHIAHITTLLQSLDQPKQQIRIKAEVISLSHKVGQTLGAQFNSSETHQSASVNGTANTFFIPLFRLANNTQLNMQLQALIQHGKAKLLANPDLMTLNLQPASIESGEQIPYQQATASGATSVAFKEAALKLQVTPTILPSNHVQLQLQLNQDTVSALKVGGIPAIATQQLHTTIITKNNETAALGGIITHETSNQHHRIPLLHQIPLLGRLFSDHHTSKREEELMILVTPTIQS